MIKKLLFIISIISILSCGSEPNDNVYKTKSGEFASKPGNFIAAFPTEPNYSAIDNQLGLDKFKIHLFTSTLGPNKRFAVEYIDFPEHMISSISNEQYFDQGVANFTNKMSGSFDFDFQEPVEQHGLTGRYFVLRLNESTKNKGVKGYIEGKLFRDGNRVYTVTYLGHLDKNTDAFMKSFRLIE